LQFRIHFIDRRQYLTMLMLPIRSRSVIHLRPMVVSALKRRAMRAFPASPLRRRANCLT
jgi:hypothetical protein